MNHRLSPRLALLLAIGTVVPSLAAADAVEYMIVTAERLADEFEPLASWRTAHGLSAEVRTVEWITAHYPGVDDAESIRLFVRDAYASLGTLFVLLGGDAEIVPVRYARSTFFTTTDIPTDYYFMCLDGTWNEDGDEHFGEVEDAVDLVPETCVGRAPISTALEARAFVERTIAYESSTPEPGYPASALLLAERLGAGLHGATIAESAASRLPPSFTQRRLYTESGNWPGSLELTRQAAIAELDTGYGLVLHVGRGDRDTWGVGDGILTPADVQALRNAPRFSVVYAFAGNTAAFDMEDAIGEHWLTSSGGGVAYVGCTRLSWAGAGSSLLNEWFRVAFAEPPMGIGLVSAFARLPFIAQAQAEGPARWMLFTLALLGDPALAARVDTPAAVAPAPEEPVPVTMVPLLALDEPAPNPFTMQTTIGFSLARGANDSEIAIYDVSGRLRHRLAVGPLARGRHTLLWSGESLGGEVPPGVYIVRLEADGAAVAQKIVRN